MRSEARVALAVSLGYLLGRRRKMRTALTLAAAVAAGRASQRPGGLRKFGADLVADHPQLRNLGGLTPPLVAAGRAAATAAAGSGIDTIGGRLRDGADALRRKAGPTGDALRRKAGPAGPDGGPPPKRASSPTDHGSGDHDDHG
ncbi:hypothetical protein [Micromonospora sp. DT31]|uniref:hypothetical protein n=1 Tax=Micromonospora sp. DT31 TaxID=3393434 RepID=UPI003CFB11F2